MTVVIGVDPSLTAFGVVGPTATDREVVKVPHRKDPVRMGQLRDWILSHCQQQINAGIATDETDLLVVLEGFSLHSTTRAYQQGGLGWIVRLALFEAGIPYLELSPNTLKKYATGKGNASKDLVVSSVSARTGILFRSSDEVDAFVAWCAGRELTKQMHPLCQVPKSHWEALTGVEVGQAVGWVRRKDSAP